MRSTTRDRKPGACFLVLLALGCGTTRSVRPAGKGAHVVDVALGGPLLRLGGVVFPAPGIYAGYTYGLTEKADVFGRLNLLDGAFGVAALEAGAAYGLREQDGWIPAVSGNVSALGLWGRGGATAVPMLTATASWKVLTASLFYAGATGGLSFGKSLEGSRVAGHLSPCLGWQQPLGESPWALDFELRWDAPTQTTRPLTVDWAGPGPYGSFAPHLGISRRFGGAL